MAQNALCYFILMVKKVYLNTRVTEDEHASVRAYADARGRTVTEVVREFIRGLPGNPISGLVVGMIGGPAGGATGGLFISRTELSDPVDPGPAEHKVPTEFKGYMNLIDFFGGSFEGPIGGAVYGNPNDLLAAKPTVKEDGIVEVEVRLVRVVDPGT